MSPAKAPTAIKKRAQNRKALASFALHKLKEKLPLVLSHDPNLPPSPKPHYRSAYRYPGLEDLNGARSRPSPPSKSASGSSTTAPWNSS